MARKPAASQRALTLQLGYRKAPNSSFDSDGQKLRRVMDTIPAMVWSAFPDGSVEYVSERWLRYIGQSRDTFERQGWQALLHPEDLEKAETQWRATVAAGRQADLEHRVRRADGTYRWILTRAVPLRDERGQIVKWYGVVRDNEEKKRALQEVQPLSLSRREAEVLRLLVEGNTSKGIAAIIGVKPSTIDTYRSRIMAKLRIWDVQGLVRLAIRHGLIDA